MTVNAPSAPRAFDSASKVASPSLRVDGGAGDGAGGAERALGHVPLEVPRAGKVVVEVEGRHLSVASVGRPSTGIAPLGCVGGGCCAARPARQDQQHHGQGLRHRGQSTLGAAAMSRRVLHAPFPAGHHGWRVNPPGVVADQSGRAGGSRGTAGAACRPETARPDGHTSRPDTPRRASRPVSPRWAHGGCYQPAVRRHGRCARPGESEITESGPEPGGRSWPSVCGPSVAPAHLRWVAAATFCTSSITRSRLPLQILPICSSV